MTYRKWYTLVDKHAEVLRNQYGVDEASGASSRRSKPDVQDGFVDQIAW